MASAAWLRSMPRSRSSSAVSAIPGSTAKPLRLFFLACVVVAGLFGAVTLKAPKTLALQSLPALICTLLVWMVNP